MTEVHSESQATDLSHNTGNILKIGLIGDYQPNVVAHQAIPIAVRLASEELSLQSVVQWIPSEKLERDASSQLTGYQALWAAPATPYRSMEGALEGIRYARENQIPLLGTCGGYQHMIIEYARNVLGISNADHLESNPDTSAAIITPLTCSVNEQVLTFRLNQGSKVASIYEANEVVEQYGFCNYGLNAQFRSLFEQGDLIISGVDSEGEPRIVESVSHPFYMGTLFQPERSALRQIVHPLIKEFLRIASLR